MRGDPKADKTAVRRVEPSAAWRAGQLVASMAVCWVGQWAVCWVVRLVVSTADRLAAQLAVEWVASMVASLVGKSAAWKVVCLVFWWAV